MVVIIGAGMAGLACARELVDAGREVVVLEARDRLGGRTWTDTSLGAPVDLGASWIHGHRRNPLMRLADRHRVPIEWCDYEALGLFDQGGRLDGAIAKEARELSWWLYEWAEKLCYRHPKDDPDISVAAAMGADLSRRGGLGLKDPRSFDWALETFKYEEGVDASQISLRYFEDDDPCTGEDYLLTEGYRRFVEVLADGVDVRTGHPVERVAWREGEGATVHTQGGASFEADQVLVTLPLGVLKAGVVTFEPALPEEKRQAIEGLGVGVLDKIVARFDEPFWSDRDVLIGKLSEPHGALVEALNLEPFVGEPILVGFWGGDEARQAEARSGEELTAEFLRDLRACYGEQVSEPEDVIITRWAQDPWARGSYAHIPVGASGLFYDRLAEGVGQVLYFAGEATQRDNPGTAHGAYMSGVREAERILRGLA